jgi:hypothetical protein
MQALISPNEKVRAVDGAILGDRVAEVVTMPFEVAPPLFWIACADNVVADQWYYANDVLSPIPPIVVV